MVWVGSGSGLGWVWSEKKGWEKKWGSDQDPGQVQSGSGNRNTARHGLGHLGIRGVDSVVPAGH